LTKIGFGQILNATTEPAPVFWSGRENGIFI